MPQEGVNNQPSARFAECHLKEFFFLDCVGMCIPLLSRGRCIRDESAAHQYYPPAAKHAKPAGSFHVVPDGGDARGADSFRDEASC